MKLPAFVVNFFIINYCCDFLYCIIHSVQTKMYSIISYFNKKEILHIFWGERPMSNKLTKLGRYND